MIISRRQFALASFVVCLTALNAYADTPEEANPTASASSGQAGAGGNVSVTVNVYAKLADRTLTVNLYPILANGNRGPSAGTYTTPVPAGLSIVNTGFGPLPSGTYQAVTALRDYPVTFCGISRYLNGTAFIEQSFFNNLSIR